MAPGKSGLHARGEGERVLALAPERPQGSPASSSVWREDPGLLSRPCRKRRPSAREDVKLQYFGHLMQRVGSLEKTLMLGGIGGRRRRGRQRMQKQRGSLRFLRPLEMRPSSIAPHPVESREAPTNSTVSLSSQRHPGKFPKVPGRRRGTRGFPAAPRQRPRESFFNASRGPSPLP